MLKNEPMLPGDGSFAKDAPSVLYIASTEITFGTMIGGGSYGDVYHGQWQGNAVAVKQLHLKTLPEDLKKDFEQEISVMARCQSPYIVALQGACMESGHYALVMEYLPKGDLFHVLHNADIELPWESTRYQIAVDIGKGLAYLHRHHVMHRDLKSLNILLDAHFGAKIGDFGLSKIKQSTASTSTNSQKKLGTIRWRAPESFKRGYKPTDAMDIYSYGVVLWEIASRQLPFSDAPDEITVLSWIKDGEKPEAPLNCPLPYERLIQDCWNAPEKRPEATTLVSALEKLIPKEKPTTTSHHRKSKSHAKSKAATIPYQDLTFEKNAKNKLVAFAEGGFGVVYKGRYGGYAVAIKKLKNSTLTHADLTDFNKEVAAMKKANNPNIVRFYGACIHKKRYYMVMDFLPGGSLRSLLDKEKPSALSWSFRFQMAKDMVEGLYYLHQNNMLHRDIKADNVLLDRDTRHPNQAYRAKLADLGLACQLQHRNQTISSVKGGTLNSASSSMVGTLPWMAPEILEAPPTYAAASDIYAYGVALWEILTHDIPFPNGSLYQIIAAVTSGERPPLNEASAPAMYEDYPEMIVSSWSQNPEERPSSKELKDYLGARITELEASTSTPAPAAQPTSNQSSIHSASFATFFSAKQDKRSSSSLDIANQSNHALQQPSTSSSLTYTTTAQHKTQPKSVSGQADYQTGLQYCIKCQYKAALPYFKKAAEHHYPAAYLYLGYLYEVGGRIGPKDEAISTQRYQQAAKHIDWFQQQAKTGSADAQYNLGDCYYDGHGVKQDYTKAATYFRQAADQGYAAAQTSLGLCYDEGHGVKQDYVEAVSYYRQAADQGYAAAQTSLGFCYYNGHGVKQDYTKAVSYYRQAADQGDDTAKDILAELLKEHPELERRSLSPGRY